MLALREKISVKGIAHITGGGMQENVPRILNEKLRPSFDYSSLAIPPIFRLIQRSGGIPDSEMYHTFNMGVGLVLVVAKKDAKKTIAFLNSKGERAWALGSIERK